MLDREAIQTDTSSSKGNSILNKAKYSSNNTDEWYTTYETIEEELAHYEDAFEGKVVLCNCDDPYESNFSYYFLRNFNKLKLKKLICTSYAGSKIDSINGNVQLTIDLFFDDGLPVSVGHGVFKDFCRRAKTVNVPAMGTVKIKDHPRIWVMLLGGPGMTSLKEECFSKNEVRIGWHEIEDDSWSDDETISWRVKQMLHAFTYEMEPGDIVFIERDSQSIDAIGVIAGDYEYDKSLGRYPRRRRVNWIVKNINENMVQYLPRGRKQLARFSVYSADYLDTDAISEILNKYMQDNYFHGDKREEPYVFIIDEINRGNISKIFGELITLIEDTKRAGAPEAMEAILPYSGEPFSVPNNVFILGTMNTADRSIALMDTALRRRFEFTEMMPDPEILKSLGVGTIVVGGEELDVARMLDVINKRIEFLFDREHTIGHAFFTKLAQDPSIETLAGIFEKNVIPLLQEYFYEDYEKIQLVLGDNAKDDEYKFVLDRPLKIKDVFNGNPDIDLPEKSYVIQREAFFKLESYKQIGKDL